MTIRDKFEKFIMEADDHGWGAWLVCTTCREKESDNKYVLTVAGQDDVPLIQIIEEASKHNIEFHEFTEPE